MVQDCRLQINVDQLPRVLQVGLHMEQALSEIAGRCDATGAEVRSDCFDCLLSL